jgi:TonB family protein
MKGAALLPLACLAALAAPAGAEPRILLVPPVDYPADVTPGDRAFETNVRYRLNATGHVSECTTAHSSGRPSLDAESCHILLTRARIRPEAGMMRGQIVVRWLGAARAEPHQARGEPLQFELAQAITDGDYPAQAVARHEQGTVAYAITVSPVGAPRLCTIVQSSGSALLDQHTCDIVLQRAAFVPATDGTGPLGGVAHGRIRWVLPD